ncbi:MAG: type II toxin-antitoxin system VapC family toxin, partial [Synechococcaceae cyanobacterium ELA182]
MTGSTGSAYLLDSHVLLWWWFDPSRLSTAVHELLVDSSSEIRVSAASVWELSLKHHRGKLPELAGAIDDLPGLLQADGFQGLPIS